MSRVAGVLAVVVIIIGEFVRGGEEVEGPAVEGEGELDFGFVGVAGDGGGAAGEGGAHYCRRYRVCGGGGERNKMERDGMGEDSFERLLVRSLVPRNFLGKFLVHC